MSFLIDTDLLSLLERKRVPARLGAWVKDNQADIFQSAVSWAELQFGLGRAPATHQASLAAWLADLRRKLASATVGRVAGRVEGQEPHDDLRGLPDCRDSLVPGSHNRYP